MRADPGSATSTSRSRTDTGTSREEPWGSLQERRVVEGGVLIVCQLQIDRLHQFGELGGCPSARNGAATSGRERSQASATDAGATACASAIWSSAFRTPTPQPSRYVIAADARGLVCCSSRLRYLPVGSPWPSRSRAILRGLHALRRARYHFRMVPWP